MRQLQHDVRPPSGPLAPPGTHPLQLLALAPHVRACRSGDRVIQLDLRSSRYIGIGGADTPLLAHAIQGWPGDAPTGHLPAGEAASDAAVHALTRPLLAQGLLTKVTWLDARVACVEPATASLNADGSTSATPMCAARILNFLLSALLASLQLKYQNLMAISTRLQTADASLRRLHQPVDAQSTHDAVDAFYRLRPLVFTSKDRCLQDSLILKVFLAREGIPATWVVGVRADPFAAHSWVQSGHLVLNDQHEHVRAFQPILVV